MRLVLNPEIWNSYTIDSFEVNFAGNVFYEDKLITKAQDIANLICDSDELSLSNFFNKCNGNFAVTIHFNQTFFLICDLQKSYPLFIIMQDNDFTICDSLYEIEFRKRINWNAVEQYVVSGWVYGNKTIYEGVVSVQPGEIVSFKGSRLERLRYYRFNYNPFLVNMHTDKEVFTSFEIAFSGLFARLIKTNVNNSNWIIPLSGGYDSRLIAYYLYKLGQKNVICFSYGNPGNIQSNISEQVAKALGFKWYFVEYSEKDWNEVHENGLFDKFIDVSFNGSTLPHFQDFLAIYRLKEAGVFQDGDIVLPGHTAITEATKYSLDDVVDLDSATNYVVRTYASNWSSVKEANIGIKLALKEMIHENNLEPYALPEFFNWQERQAKFISNSVRVYEFFGLSWRLPFWDRDIADLWLSIDYDRRVQREVFLRANREYILNTCMRQIPFADKWKKKKSLKRKLISATPIAIRNLILSIFNVRADFAEGLNYVYALRGKTLRELISAYDYFPDEIKEYFSPFIDRSPRHVNNHLITILHTLSRQFDTIK